MDGWWLVGLALGLPWAAGIIWLRLSWRGPLTSVWPLVIGYGYVLGLLAVTVLLRLQNLVGLKPDMFGPILIIGALILLGGWLLWRQTKDNAFFKVNDGGWSSQPQWQRWAFAVLLAWLSWRLMGLALEIWWRPLYPWDAWTTWAVQPKVWAELGQLAPFVDPQRWLVDGSGMAYTLEAWTYPITVPLLALWSTLAWGGWNETAANLPWLGLALALGFGFYGQARWWGATPLLALIFTWLLLSLPLLDTHIALAGYADLWMMVVFSLAAIAFFQWLRTGHCAQGVLALALACACPFIKLEGTVWLSIFVPALVVFWLWGWRLWLLAITMVVLGILWWWVGGITFKVPGLGEFLLRPDVIQMPYLGRFSLAYRGTWTPVLKNFFALANWHLYWYLFVTVAVVAVPARWAERWRRTMAVFIGSCLLMLFILFFMTDAQRWAEEYTSINRVFLHCIPVLLFWVMTVFIPPTKTDQSPAPFPSSERSLISKELVV
jgi:hypothetical protein